jgi:flagellar secretion chaperone FliS
MAGYPQGAQLGAYQKVAAHGGVAAADPHGLVLMLMDGALQRIAAARGCIERGKLSEKSQLLHRVVQILGELRGSLDLSAGGQIANNLSELYDYMCRRLLAASLENSVAMLDEVAGLLRDIRGAWTAIPQEARSR